MTVILRYNSKVTPVVTLPAEKIANAIFIIYRRGILHCMFACWWLIALMSANRQTDKKTYRLTDIQRERQRDIQTDRQTD